MQSTLFISDLHLDPIRPEITRLFLDFLGKQAPAADALYILGDLFEVWIGDDDDTPLNRDVINALNTCATAGTPVFIMHGNRDFLLGDQFAAMSNCSLLADPAYIDLYGTPTLLMHGDTLCTDDDEYMKLRQLVRNPEWQQEMLSKPLEIRREIADDMRKQSREQNSGKPESIMDVNQQAVSDTMSKKPVTRRIHGHTHRPAVHDLEIDGRSAQRIVLGDWYEQGSMLECSPEGCVLHELSATETHPS